MPFDDSFSPESLSLRHILDLLIAGESERRALGREWAYHERLPALMQAIDEAALIIESLGVDSESALRAIPRIGHAIDYYLIWKHEQTYGEAPADHLEFSIFSSPYMKYHRLLVKALTRMGESKVPLRLELRVCSVHIIGAMENVSLPAKYDVHGAMTIHPVFARLVALNLRHGEWPNCETSNCSYRVGEARFTPASN